MSETGLDEVDRAILYQLQMDARTPNAEIAESVGVSPSTVGKRLDALERSGTIKGYRPEVDYEQAGYPIHVLFVCTASITQREPLIQEALDVEAVVNVRELMTGQRNVHIQVVGRENDDITQAAHAIDDLGFTVNDEVLMRSEINRPSDIFRDADAFPVGSGR